MATAPLAILPDPHVWRVSVERYHDMIGAGVLTPEDRVELLEGVIVQQMSKKPPHVGVCATLNQQLNQRLPKGWYVRPQEPVTLADSEPEPDLAVVRGSIDHYFDRHPGPSETALVIEVADSTLTRDRDLKRRIYARAGIAVYWLVDLNGRTVTVFDDPLDATYQRAEIFTDGGVLTAVLDGLALEPIAVSEILPPRN